MTLVACVVLLGGCLLRQPNTQTRIEWCPPPPPVICVPVPATDTIHPWLVGTTIGMVRGLDTDDDEWQIMSPSGRPILVAGAHRPAPTFFSFSFTSPSSVTVRIPLETAVLEYASMIVPGIANVSTVEVSNGSVVDATPHSFTSPMHWSGHPTFSADRNVVIFASELPEGLGGLDLWYSTRFRGNWTKPRLCGTVSSTCDEMTPFIFSGNSSLYFASRGHATHGGYDLFVSRIVKMPNDDADSLVLGAPVNLGSSVNTNADEIFPYRPAAEGSARLYWSSNRRRPGIGGNFDMWVAYAPTTSFTPDTVQPPIVALPKDTARRVNLSGIVLNEQTGVPVPDAEVRATDEIRKSVVDTTRTDTAGQYTLRVPVDVPLTITAQSDTLFFDTRRIQLPSNAQDTTIETPFQLPVVYFLRINFPTAIFDDPYPVTLDAKGQETDQTWQAATELLARNVIASGQRLRRLVLIGHTDDVGSDKSNKLLGQRRVEFVAAELIRLGVSANLLELRSAGESMLPTRERNEIVDQWRKRSRRVELVKVMKDVE